MRLYFLWDFRFESAGMRAETGSEVSNFFYLFIVVFTGFYAESCLSCKVVRIAGWRI